MKRKEDLQKLSDFPDLCRYNHLVEEIDHLYHTIATRLGVSDSVLMLLYIVKESGGSCLLRTVYESTGIPKQTLNSALRRMEADEILTLSSAGGRAKKIFLTASGAAFADRTAGRLMAAENAVFAAWKSEDVERYLSLTERFLSDLSREAREIGLSDITSVNPEKGEMSHEE